MAKPRIAVFSGPAATIANSPPLVTSNKARLKGERTLMGRYDHLVPQLLFEPVKVKIMKFTAHPLEEDSSDVYHDNGKPYYEVTLRPEDGPYLLPYMARRADGSKNGVPFEANDLQNPNIKYGSRQGFYPDASRIFTEINRTVYGRSEEGEGSILDRKADYDFIRVLPPGGYTKKGEVSGVDYFPYKPIRCAKTARVGDLARAANIVQKTLDTGKYEGGVWLEGSTSVEESIYWFSLLLDTDMPVVGNAAQRCHGQLSNDGDINIIDSVDYVISGKGRGLGAVGIQDQRIFAAREFKKADDRPGNYKTTGGHGGILGSVKHSVVTIWYRPNYKHGSTSEVNINKLPTKLEFQNKVGDTQKVSIRVKKADGTLRYEVIPRVHIFKYSHYLQEDETETPDHEVDIIARIKKASAEQYDSDENVPKLHGFVLEGTSPYATGTRSQMRALEIAALSGIPVARVGRSDPGGRVLTIDDDLFIEGSNLDANKARLLLIASMLKLGRLPKARNPRNPTAGEREAIIEKIREFQEIFEMH